MLNHAALPLYHVVTFQSVNSERYAVLPSSHNSVSLVLPPVYPCACLPHLAPTGAHP
jgi:hypothetical protein